MRVIQKTDLNAITTVPPENSATLENSAGAATTTNSSSCDSAPQTPGPLADQCGNSSSIRAPFNSQVSSSSAGGSLKCKAERADSFTKLKLSPKAFRFTGKLCRSKSEIEKDSPDTSYALNQIEVSTHTRGGEGRVRPLLGQCHIPVVHGLISCCLCLCGRSSFIADTATLKCGSSVCAFVYPYGPSGQTSSKGSGFECTCFLFSVKR